MTADTPAVDPYEAVLADLRAKRDQIDNAISTLEAVRSGTPAPHALSTSKSSLSLPQEGPGAFLGMTIVDAAKALLATRRKPLGNPEITSAFKAGGMVLNSADPVNTIGSVLTRRFNQVGDIVRVGRGMWGLAEWYPNRNFKRKPATGKSLGDGAAAFLEAASDHAAQSRPLQDPDGLPPLSPLVTPQPGPRGHSYGAARE